MVSKALSFVGLVLACHDDFFAANTPLAAHHNSAIVPVAAATKLLRRSSPGAGRGGALGTAGSSASNFLNRLWSFFNCKDRVRKYLGKVTEEALHEVETKIDTKTVEVKGEVKATARTEMCDTVPFYRRFQQLKASLEKTGLGVTLKKLRLKKGTNVVNESLIKEVAACVKRDHTPSNLWVLMQVLGRIPVERADELPGLFEAAEPALLSRGLSEVEADLVNAFGRLLKAPKTRETTEDMKAIAKELFEMTLLVETSVNAIKVNLKDKDNTTDLFVNLRRMFRENKKAIFRNCTQQRTVAEAAAVLRRLLAKPGRAASTELSREQRGQLKALAEPDAAVLLESPEFWVQCPVSGVKVAGAGGEEVTKASGKKSMFSRAVNVAKVFRRGRLQA